jgi:hypothetical protein
MPDAFAESLEDRIARRFAPVYVSSSDEGQYLAELEPRLEPRIRLAHPSWKPYIYCSALKLETAADIDAYEINYLSIWDWDTGGILGILSRHKWDTERSAILVVGPKGETDPEGFESREAYFAAHEGTAFDSSTYIPVKDKKKGAIIFWSEGKHASYPSIPPKFHFDRFEPPGNRVDPADYELKGVGTLKCPAPHAPWILFDKGWGPEAITPVCKQLSSRLWNPGTLDRTRIGELKREDILALQNSMGLEPTGEIDRATFKKASHLSPALVRNASKLDQDQLKLALKESHAVGFIDGQA